MGRALVAAGAAALIFSSALLLQSYFAAGDRSGPASPTSTVASDASLSTATFAGGCFWCIESAFDGVPGVASAVSGYSGGEKADPSYREVSAGGTGHVEVVQIRFDADTTTYTDLLDIFWRQIDPTDADGQFADRGDQYRTFIYYHDDEQRRLAEASKAALGASGRFDSPLVTEIVPALPFYVAEEYHQDYHLKNPVRYKQYRYASGRTPFLESVWGGDAHGQVDDQGDGRRGDAEEAFVKPADDDLRQRLTPLQYEVTQREGTEIAFQNEYWDNKAEGIYVDVVSGEPLFSSTDKFASGTGWPSFTRPLDTGGVIERIDWKLFIPRTEVRSRQADGHLGHVFDDGPPPTGIRYCVNSASLRFVPRADLEQEGYGEYLRLFDPLPGASADADTGRSTRTDVSEKD